MGDEEASGEEWDNDAGGIGIDLSDYILEEEPEVTEAGQDQMMEAIRYSYIIHHTIHHQPNFKLIFLHYFIIKVNFFVSAVNMFSL